MTCICYLQTLPKIPIGINTEMKLFIELCIWVVQLTTNFFAFMCKKIYTYKNNTVNLSAQNSYSIQHLNHIKYNRSQNVTCKQLLYNMGSFRYYKT